ncbi:MAG: hypothetical protein EXS46_01215 [Candidatus Taylorbacteria bacterium]|nr:hypothetical protein [Candidatus Taylorbacteria bacterium]
MLPIIVSELSKKGLKLKKILFWFCVVLTVVIIVTCPWAKKTKGRLIMKTTVKDLPKVVGDKMAYNFRNNVSALGDKMGELWAQNWPKVQKGTSTKLVSMWKGE